MILARDIVAVIEEFAAPSLAESYDNTGFLIGDLDSEISKLLLTVDVTPEVVAEAIEQGANMILSHHPLIFGGVKKLNGTNDIERSIIELIKNNIALYSCHTSIDAVVGGISYRLGEQLSLSNMVTLAPKNENSDGFGVVGDLSSPVEAIEFLQLIKNVFNVKYLRYTKPHVENICRVAICGGSGSSLLSDAKRLNADIYISADFKYHDFFETNGEIMIADIGHYESEKVVLNIFSDIISKKYPNFAILKSSRESNPILYL
ncbi:MAG: Nif3-like dinuclear metal center hexameric protein [Rikenellaceae bacterium]